MIFFPFKSNIIYSSDQLPSTLMTLEDWSFIIVDGEDSKKYLQGQLTVDVFALQKTHYTLCAHCNFNGKVWSTMYLFHYKKYYAYIERRSVVENQIKELKKYSIFSKVEIRKQDDICLLGLAGLNAKFILSTIFSKIPNNKVPIVCVDSVIILWFKDPSERFLLVLSFHDAYLLKKKIDSSVILNNSQQWLLLDIEAGFPVIDNISSSKFIPQAINLNNLNAISFKKGCYYGQEIISRIFFKKLNKRFLSYLVCQGNIVPQIGSIIKIKKEDKWHKIGILIASVCVRIEETWIQVVLDKPIDKRNIFRIHQFKNIFFIHS